MDFKLKISIRVSLILITVLMAVFLYSRPILAHQGRTASDGCHYCRTRCDYWGVPWNQRHCHNGGTSIKKQDNYLYPLTSPSPSPKPKKSFWQLLFGGK